MPGRPRVLHTPGHTPGEVVFHLADRNVLISGDTLVTRNLLTGEMGRPQIVSEILNDNMTQANRSLDLIRELGHVTMLPGHGKPWVGKRRLGAQVRLWLRVCRGQGVRLC